MSRQTVTTITIGRKKITDFRQLTLHQSTDDHHKLTLQVGQHWFAENGDNLYRQVRELIGERLFLQIQSSAGYGPPEDGLEYRGIITDVTTGKEAGGTAGTCCITAASPTLLMDDHPHTEAYADMTIKSITRRHLRHYPQNLLYPRLDPAHTDFIPYTVQYAENTWAFLRRLTGRWGEWLFYDGMSLILGRYEGDEYTLTHEGNLEAFGLSLTMQPTGQRFHGYEYRGDQTSESEAADQPDENLDEISAHVLEKSDAFYGRTALRRVNQPLGTSPSRQIRQMAGMQRRTDIAGMVTARGRSTCPKLGPGRIARIKEAFGGQVEYGRYFITGITHHCDAEGNYYNRFTARPAETAHPPFAAGRTAYAEPQSATVMDNHDPEGLGRIRVQFRWQNGGQMSPWLRIISAAGGGDKGFYMIPEKDEEVMVDFEGGNPERPYVLGATYNGGAKSSYTTKNNDKKAIKTRSGNEMAFDDDKGDIRLNSAVGKVAMNMKGDGTADLKAPECIDLEAKEINLSADRITISGGNSILIRSRPGLDDAGPGTIILEAKQDMSIVTKNKGVLLRSKSLGISTEEGIKMQDGKAIIYQAPNVDVE